MEYINNREKLQKIKKTEDFFVIIDFDRTLTTSKSDASMGIIPKFLGGDCLKERLKIYEYYRPLELDYTIEENEKKSIMKEWANTSFTLLSKYLKSEEIIENALENANLHLRPGAKEFLEYMHNKNIPVVIMSAGVGNIIKRFLEMQQVLYDNITLISNFLEIKNSRAYIDTKGLIAVSDKDYSRVPEEIRKKLDKKQNILLCGDIIEDINMVEEERLDDTLTIGFLDVNIEQNLEEYNNKFDIVLTKNSNFFDVKNILNIY